MYECDVLCISNMKSQISVTGYEYYMIWYLQQNRKSKYRQVPTYLPSIDDDWRASRCAPALAYRRSSISHVELGMRPSHLMCIKCPQTGNGASKPWSKSWDPPISSSRFVQSSGRFYSGMEDYDRRAVWWKYGGLRCCMSCGKCVRGWWQMIKLLMSLPIMSWEHSTRRLKGECRGGFPRSDPAQMPQCFQPYAAIMTLVTEASVVCWKLTQASGTRSSSVNVTFAMHSWTCIWCKPQLAERKRGRWSAVSQWYYYAYHCDLYVVLGWCEPIWCSELGGHRYWHVDLDIDHRTSRHYCFTSFRAPPTSWLDSWRPVKISMNEQMNVWQSMPGNDTLPNHCSSNMIPLLSSPWSRSCSGINMAPSFPSQSKRRVVRSDNASKPRKLALPCVYLLNVQNGISF